MLRGFVKALSSNYMLLPSYAENLAAIAYLVKAGKMPIEALSVEVGEGANTATVYETERGKVSLLTMEGPLFRDDQFCGPVGMLTMNEHLKRFDNDETIAAHVIKMHTPGGEIGGVEILAETVANTQKPVIIFGEDIYSAGVYIAAGASAIVLSGKNAGMGSIGVMVNYYSFKEMFEKEGIKEVMIRATTSPDKNSFNYHEHTEEEALKFAKEILDPLDTHFMDHVRTHRPGVSESALTGKTFYAEQAIKLGLADHIGTFESAVQLALDMAGKPNKNGSIMSKEKTTDKKETGTNPSSDSQSDLQATKAAQEERIKALEEMVGAKDKVIALHLETIETQKTVISTLKEQNEILSKLPASDPEAETTTAEADVTTQTESAKPAGTPVPAAIQSAIEAGQRRRSRHVKKGIIKPENN